MYLVFVNKLIYCCRKQNETEMQTVYGQMAEKKSVYQQSLS